MPKSDGWFRPGTSGNPGGRPKCRFDARDHAQAYAGRVIFGLMQQAVRHGTPAKDRRAAAKLLLRIGFGGSSGIGPGILRQLGWHRVRAELDQEMQASMRELGTREEQAMTGVVRIVKYKG